jgi:hypothetical protein
MLYPLSYKGSIYGGKPTRRGFGPHQWCYFDLGFQALKRDF